jgi:uncharacterized membrane protein SpoIIM required for sporulation
MRETQFIRQNQDKWQEFEDVLSSKYQDPEKLNDIYVQITDDLSYARTFYPARSVRAYLNRLAQQVFIGIFKQKRSPFKRLSYFFKEELPHVVYESRSAFMWAVIFGLLSFVIGYFSTMQDPEFPRLILGDSYVDMTNKYIHSGDPMKVYKEHGHVDMTFSIMLNNLWVAFEFFILGVFGGILSMIFMMYNGVMVGAFLAFFANNHLLKTANLAIWMHGTFEISAIVISTAAGITMGRGLLFPGTYTRLQAFQMSARNGIKIMVGVTVLLVVAAIIEGNLTRYTDVGDTVRGLFIGLCFAIVVFYFGWYPFYKAKKGFAKPSIEAELPPDSNYKLEFMAIKPSGRIFGDTFYFFNKNIGYYIRTAAFCGVFLTAYCCLFSDFTPRFMTHWLVVVDFFTNEHIRFLAFAQALLLSIVGFSVYRIVLREEGRVDFSRQKLLVVFIEFFVASLIFVFLANVAGFIFFMVFAILFPFIGLWMYLMYRDGFNPFSALQHAWWLMTTSWGMTFGTYYTMLLVGYLFFLFSGSSIMDLSLQMLGWNTGLTKEALDISVVVFMTFVDGFVFYLVMALLFTSMAFLYYSLLEINEAKSLLERIKLIGVGKKIQGIARE